MHWSVENVNEGMAKTLIDYGIDLEGSDESGMTAFLYASTRNHLPLLQLLHSHGANIHHKAKVRLN